MRRKKHLDRAGGGGGGGTELFICFTSRPSASGLRPSASSKAFSPGRSAAAGAGGGSSGAGAADAPPGALLRPSLSRRLRNSGSLKGGQSPMFPPGTASGGRRGRGGMEPAEPSSPKVTCIGQVRVKGGKRKPKHGSAAAAAALRSRSRRGVGGGSEASFRRGVDDRDTHPGAKNQGWVYQIPVNICEALKTFGSCGGRSLCSPSRDRPRPAAGDKKRRRAPAGGSWLCGAAVARCLLAIQEEDDDVGKGSAVGPADEARESQVGLVMQGWDVEDDEEAYEVDDDETRVVVGAVEVEKEDEILLVGGKEEEGRVSVCIPPRNALLLMRCRSDPVRMAELATRFWGSPAAATASVGQVCNEEDAGVEGEEDEGDANVEKECAEEARNSGVSVDGDACREPGGVAEDDGGEAADAGQAESEDESSKHGDIGEEEDGGGCRGDGEEKDEPVVAQIVRKDVGLEVALAGEAAKSDSQAPTMVEAVVGTKENADVPRMEKDEEELKGRRSVSSCSPSTALKEDRKLRRLGSTRRRVSTSSKASSSSDRVDRRHSFSAEMEARRSSFSSLKDSRRASFSIDRDGRRWSFTIEQEHLVAEPKVLMASRKGKKNSSEAESEKDRPVLVAPNSVEEAQECNDDVKEEATNDDGEEEGTIAECAEINSEVEKVETRVDEEKAVEVKQERRKKSGELPDCLLMMMCEPKLSMEVSKETWVCSTDFVHWKSHQGQNRRQQKTAATGSNAAALEETKDDSNNALDTSVTKDTEESVAPASVNPVSMPPQAAPKPVPKPAVEQKLKLELPKVAAYAPLVLKRCKSEPLRSSARLAPDTCFWKEDRHRPLNATGIGF